MGRILAVDYGLKRCGIAVTDPLQIIVNGLDAVEVKDVLNYILDYCKKESVDQIILGYPLQKDGSQTEVTQQVDKLKLKLEQALSTVTVILYPEKNTSTDAMKILVDGGVRKSRRTDKFLLDKMSAVVILQRYLGHI